jgi:hypothetical protein
MDEIEKLYKVAKEKGLYTKSFDEFITKYSDENNRQKLYDVVKEQGLYTKSQDEFNSKYFATPLKKKVGTEESSVTPSVSVSTPTVEPPKKNLLGFGGDLESYKQEETAQPQIQVTDRPKPIAPSKEPKAQEFLNKKAEEEKPQNVLNGIKEDVKKMASYGVFNTTDLLHANADSYADRYLDDQQKQEYNFVKNIQNLETQAQNNPNVAEYRQALQIANESYDLYRQNKNADIDAQIAELDAKPYDIADNQKKIATLQAQKEDFFKDKFEKTYSENKDAIDELKIEGKTPKEQMVNYYLVLQKKAEQLQNKLYPNGVADVVRTNIPFGASDYEVSLKKQLDQTEATLKQLTPIVLINRSPLKGSDGFWTTAAKKAVSTVLPNAEGYLPTEGESANLLNVATVQAGIDPKSINKGVESDVFLKEQSEKPYSANWWGNLAGTSAGMMPNFMVAGGLLKGVPALAKFNTALNGTKFGRFIASAATTGAEYQAAGYLAPDGSTLSDEGSFMAGFLGGAFTKVASKVLNQKVASEIFNKVFGTKANAAAEIVSAIGRRTASGLGEIGEELGNSIGQLVDVYQKTGNWEEVKKQFNDQFGTASKNMEFFISTFVMGLAMGGGNQIGNAMSAAAKDQYEALSSEEKKQADEFKDAINNDVKEATVETVKADPSGYKKFESKLITPEQKVEVAQAKEILLNENTTPAEKIEAAKVVQDIEAQAQETEVADELAKDKSTISELNIIGQDIGFDKPLRKDYQEGDKGDKDYANDNLAHIIKTDNIIGNITEEGTLTDSVGNKYGVTITAQGVRVVNLLNDGTEGEDIVYRKGKRVSPFTPFTNGFKFTPLAKSDTKIDDELLPEVKVEPPVKVKPVIQAVDDAEVMKQMKPFTDKMANIKREFGNAGYKIETAHDGEINIYDKNGDMVEDIESVPENLQKKAQQYEKATMKLGEFDDRLLQKSLEESRKVEDVAAEVVEPKQIQQELTNENGNTYQKDMAVYFDGNARIVKSVTKIGNEYKYEIELDNGKTIWTNKEYLDKQNKELPPQPTNYKIDYSPLPPHKEGSIKQLFRGYKDNIENNRYGQWWTGSKKQAEVFANDSGKKGNVGTRKIDLSKALRTPLVLTSTHTIEQYSQALGLSEKDILEGFTEYEQSRIKAGIQKAHQILENKHIQNLLKEKGFDMIEAVETHGVKTTSKSYLIFNKEITNEQSTNQNKVTTGDVKKEEPAEPKESKAEEKAREKRRFTKQFVKEYPKLEESLKEDTVYYDKLPNSVTLAEANGIIDYLGEYEATKAFKDLTNGMPLATRMTIGQLLIKKFEADGDYDKAIDVLEEVTTRATELGQGIQALAMFPNLSPEGELRKAQREINKQTDKLKKKAKPKIDAIQKEMGIVNKVAVEEVIKKVKPKIEQTDKIVPKETPTPKEYGAANIVVTKDRYKAAKKALKGKFFSNIPPELIEVAVYHMEASGRQFTEFTRNMVKDFGNKVKPHLHNLYSKAKQQLINSGYSEADFTNDADLTEEIKDILKEEGTTIDKIVREHYTVYDKTKQSLTDKLIEKAGLDPKEAQDFANVVQKEFDRIATDKKKALLNKQFTKKEKILKSKEVKGLEDEIIKLTNLGAFDDEAIMKAYAEKMGWPKLTAKDAAEIKRLADIVQKAPPGLYKFKATEDLLKYQGNLAGLNKFDIALSIWYANILSGYNTQEVNAASGLFNAIGEYITAVSQNPKTGVALAKGFANGFIRGGLEAKATLKTGYSPIRGKADIPPLLERVNFKGGNLNPVNYLKYVRRAMVATDVLFFEGLKEMRAYEFANMLAAKDAKLDPNINQKIRAAQYLGKTDDITQSAIETAQKEYEERMLEVEKLGTEETRKQRRKEADIDRKRRVYELIEQQRSEEILTESQSFAARGTYNYKPEGLLGWAAEGLNRAGQSFAPFRLVVPFTNIIANVANESMNYTPWGFARAATNGAVSSLVSDKFLRKDFENMTQKQLDRAKSDMMTKAIIGTTLMTALYMLSKKWDDDDEPAIEITANGTGDYKKNYQLQQTGWQPYSIKIGNRWYSYQNTPLMVGLSFIGNIRDFEEYRKEKVTDEGLATKIGAASTATSRVLFDMTFLKNLSSFMGTLANAGKENLTEDVVKTAINTGKGFVVPNLYLQATKDIQNIFDIPTKEVGTSLTGNLLRDFPIARNMYFDKLNVLGDPIVPDTDKLWSKTIDDPLFQLIADKSAFIMPTSIKKITIYDDAIKAERLLTDEEFYNYSKARGQHIKEYLQKNLKTLQKESKEVVQEKIKKEAAKATKESKKAIGGTGEDHTPQPRR